MRSSFARPAVVAAAVLAVLVFGTSAGGQVGDPPGNNGTVKVEGLVMDDVPDNEPHVGCVFRVEFYGFDQGNLFADVTFTLVNGPVLATDEVFIGEDPAGGGTDLDADEVYNLRDALAGIEPDNAQGYHVRLDVNAEGSIGDDSKSKVFWIHECARVPSGPTSTTSTTTSTTTTPAPTTTTSTPRPRPGPPAVPAPAVPIVGIPGHSG